MEKYVYCIMGILPQEVEAMNEFDAYTTALTKKFLFEKQIKINDNFFKNKSLKTTSFKNLFLIKKL